MLEVLFFEYFAYVRVNFTSFLLVSRYNDEAKTTVIIIAIARFCHTYCFVLHMFFVMPRVAGPVTCCCYGCWH